MQITFTKRYNKNLQRNVYYAKSNNSSANLLAALLKHYNFSDYAFKTCASTTHKHCLKAINTNTGNILHTNYTF